MKQKLIALDMDGTLLNDARTISSENKQALNDACDAGHLVMICSGRPHTSLSEFLAEMGLAGLPISASNGTVTLVDGEIINRVLMDKAVVEKTFEWLIKHEFPFNFYTDAGVFNHAMFFEWAWQDARKRPDFAEQESEYKRIENYFQKIIDVRFNTWNELPTDLGIFKVFVLTTVPTRKKMLEEYMATVSGVMYTSSFPHNIEITDVNGHKGTGITAVANHFNIPLVDTVAMGDNFNDIGMLNVAGFAVAMGNAEAEIKEIADVVTLTNNEHGVAYAIRQYLLS